MVRMRGESECFQSDILRHQPLGTDVVELDLHPALLFFVLTKAAV